MDIELVTRAALDAANAVAWPGDNDAAPSIADEDDLRKVLEAAAPHIVDAHAETLGIQGWYIDIDGHGEPTVWKPGADDPKAAVPVARIGSTDPDLWNLLTALIPYLFSEPELLTCEWCRREYDPTEGDADEIFCCEEHRAESQADFDSRQDDFPGDKK